MENRKIVFLHELKFTDRDIEKIGKDTFAFITTFAFAVDEISVFSKLLIQSVGNRPNDEVLLQLYAIQHNAITRVLSAKVFETIKLFGKYQRYLEKHSDGQKLEALEDSRKSLEVLTRSPSHKLSKRLRDQITNHFDFDASRENLNGHVSQNASKSIFLNKFQGNSFSPLGEEVVFKGGVWRYIKEDTRTEVDAKRLREWTDWNQQAAGWAIKAFNGFILWILETEFPEKNLERKAHYLEPELFGDMKTSKLPIVFNPIKTRKDSH